MAFAIHCVGINQLEWVDAVRSSAQGFDRLSPNGWFKFKGADSIIDSIRALFLLDLELIRKLCLRVAVLF
jgi:hypothetical protein